MLISVLVFAIVIELTQNVVHGTESTPEQEIKIPAANNEVSRTFWKAVTI